MQKLITKVLVCSCSFLVLAGCGKTYSYKYRLTVSIRDHGELKTASNVIFVKEMVGPTGNGARPAICGAATLIRLKNGGLLFALLNGPQQDAVIGQFHWLSAPTGVLLNRLNLETQYGWKDDSGILRLPETRTPIRLVPYEMPEFVTFRDASDPTTVEQVDPQKPEPTLGPEVHIETVQLETTEDYVTKGQAGSVLPWFSQRNEFLDGSRRGKAVHSLWSRQFETCDWLTYF